MNVQHFGLGTITSTLGLQKSNLMRAVKLGIGATLAITIGDLLQSRVLVRNGVSMIPPQWAPVFHALFGIMGGAVAAKKLSSEIGTGMVAGGVGIGVSALVGQVLSRTMGASSGAAIAAESAGSAPQAIAGFGLGRAFAPSMRSLAGLGYPRSNVNEPDALFGVGTPDMSGARMFNGATTAIEPSGGMSGAAVAIEPSRHFASAFTS